MTFDELRQRCATLEAQNGEWQRHTRAVEAKLAAVEALLATWERNRASPAYGHMAPGPLYTAGMAAEADSMIAGLHAALAAGKP